MSSSWRLYTSSTCNPHDGKRELWLWRGQVSQSLMEREEIKMGGGATNLVLIKHIPTSKTSVCSPRTVCWRQPPRWWTCGYSIIPVSLSTVVSSTKTTPLEQTYSNNEVKKVVCGGELEDELVGRGGEHQGLDIQITWGGCLPGGCVTKTLSSGRPGVRHWLRVRPTSSGCFTSPCSAQSTKKFCL